MQIMWENIVSWFSSGEWLVWLKDNLLSCALWLLGIIATVILSKLANKLLNWLSGKTKNEKIKSLIEKAKSIVTSCTDATTQNLVSAWKKASNGKLTAEQQVAAMNETILNTKNQLTNEVKKAIKSEYKDVDTFIKTVCEEHLHEEKVDNSKNILH